jgi:hypothetical protein
MLRCKAVAAWSLHGLFYAQLYLDIVAALLQGMGVRQHPRSYLFCNAAVASISTMMLHQVEISNGT